jgi:hypothetical protein
VLKRFRFFVLATLFATCAPIYAQTGPTGTWRVEGVGAPFPWEVALKVDGPKLGGIVKTCASNGSREIFDGAVDGNTIKFKCQSGDGRRTISFNGEIRGDEIALSWALKFQEGTPRDPRPDALFGSLAPTKFIAKRAPDGELANALGIAHGMEYAAAANLVSKDLKAEGVLFLPEKVVRVKAILVVINYGLGFQLSLSPEWHQLAQTVGGALLGVRFSAISRTEGGFAGESDDKARPEVLLSLLQRLAQETGHRELIDAPFLFWGHSGAAVAATTLASQFPERTLAFVRYHVGESQAADLTLVSKIPALILTGGKENNPYNAPSSEGLWKKGRSLGALWTFAIDPDAPHGDEEDLRYLKRADKLMIPWIEAVTRQRLSPDGTTLRPITDGSAWLGNNQTGEFAPYGAFSGLKAEASWLPDEASARAWRTALGK